MIEDGLISATCEMNEEDMDALMDGVELEEEGDDAGGAAAGAGDVGDVGDAVVVANEASGSGAGLPPMGASSAAGAPPLSPHTTTTTSAADSTATLAAAAAPPNMSAVIPALSTVAAAAPAAPPPTSPTTAPLASARTAGIARSPANNTSRAHPQPTAADRAQQTGLETELADLKRELLRSKSVIRSLETKSETILKEKEAMRKELVTNRQELVSTRQRPADPAVLAKVTDLEKELGTLRSESTFKQNEVAEADQKRSKVQRQLDAAEKELMETKEAARVASKRPYTPQLAAGSADGASNSVGTGTGATRTGAFGNGMVWSGSSNATVVQSVFNSIATALASSNASIRADDGAAAATNQTVHTVVAIQSLLTTSDDEGLSMLPVLLSALTVGAVRSSGSSTKVHLLPTNLAERAGAGTSVSTANTVLTDAGMDVDGGAAVAGARALLTGGEDLSSTLLPSAIAALRTTYELVTVSRVFRAVMLDSSAGQADATGVAAAGTVAAGAAGGKQRRGQREVDDWSPHAPAINVVAAVAADVNRFWLALYTSLGAAVTEATAMKGTGATDAWATVDCVLCTLQVLADECPLDRHNLFEPVFANQILARCIASGIAHVVLGTVNFLKTVAAMECTVEWVKTDDGEKIMLNMLRHLSGTSMENDSIALRRGLLQLLAIFAGTTSRFGEVLSRPKCSEQVITRLCLLLDAQLRVVSNTPSLHAVGGTTRNRNHELLSDACSLFVALLQSSVTMFMEQAMLPARKHKISTTISQLYRHAQPPSPLQGLETCAEDVTELVEHFRLKLV
jgi:hypothetical protein